MGLFSFGSKSDHVTDFPWRMLTSVEQLAELIQSTDKHIVFFKHSTRCSISSMAKSAFERKFPKELYNQIEFYYLDLLNFRPVSTAIAEELNVVHQSPQAIVVYNSKVIYHASHNEIDAIEISSFIQ